MELPISYLSTTIAGIIIVTLLFAYNRTAKRTIPAPKAGGAWPIIGHLPLLAGPELTHKLLGRMADKYGSIFTIQVGVHQALVVSTWEMAKEIFTTNDVIVSTRPRFAAAEHLGYNYVMFGLASYGEYWREMRKIIAIELLSTRRLQLFKDVRSSEVKTFLQELHQLWREKKDGSGQVLVELKQWFNNLNLNVILMLIARKRYFGNSGLSDVEEARRLQKAIREFFRLLGIYVVRDAIPFLGWLDVGGHEKTMKRVAKELDDIVGGWLQEHRRKRENCNMENYKEEDFMDVLISVLQGANFADYDLDMINKSACLNIIAGAGDTVSLTLTWAISLLLNNMPALQKAQEELDMYVGKERLVNESDISKLIYLQAVVKETLRLYPAAPLSAPREFSTDCTINGYHVKKGTWLFTNLSKIQRDPRVWPNASEFKPERFLTSHKDIDVRGRNFELIPFGGGRRACPGMLFALQIMPLILASFVQAFEISTPSNAPIDMTETPGLTNMKASPLEVLISPRLPPELYAYSD